MCQLGDEDYRFLVCCVYGERASGAVRHFVNQLIGHRPAGGFFTAHVPVAFFRLFARSSSCGLAPQVVIGQKSRSAKLTACRTSRHASLSADRSRSFWKAVHIFSRHIQFCEEPFTAVKAHLPKNYCVHGAYKVAINQDSPSSLTTHATYVSRTINWRHGSLTSYNRCGRVIV